MNTDLTNDEQALLDDLESLFGARADEPAPREFLTTLKQQVGDRLAPDDMSVGETMAVTVVAVIALGIGLGGAVDWSPVELVASGVAVWLFVRVAHWVGRRSAPSE